MIKTRDGPRNTRLLHYARYKQLKTTVMISLKSILKTEWIRQESMLPLRMLYLTKRRSSKDIWLKKTKDNLNCLLNIKEKQWQLLKRKKLIQQMSTMEVDQLRQLKTGTMFSLRLWRLKRLIKKLKNVTKLRRKKLRTMISFRSLRTLKNK